jgi:peptide/nickel transport system substrate-binding protein
MSAAAAMVLAACGGGGGGGGGGDASQGGVFADCATDPNGCNAVPADQLQQGGRLTFAIEKNIPNWNLNSSEGNVFETGLAVKTILPYTYFTAPDLKSNLNTDLLESAEVTSTNPQTVVYRIKPEAVWSDGTPITADDFVFNWKTQNGRDCPDCASAGNGGYDLVSSVTGSDGGKTVTATYSAPYADWQSLWGSSAPLYPAHLAAQQGDLNTPAGIAAAFTWFGATVPTYAGGPFQIADWQDNVALTLAPNPRWYGATKSKLDQVIMRVITDATQEPIALQNNEVQVIYPQPQVDLVQQVANIPGVSQTQGLGLTWEHFDLNLQTPALADEGLRDAIFVATNRQDIIAKTVGQFNDQVTPMNSHNFVQGQDGYEDVLPTEQGSGDVEAARRILTEAGYTNVAEGQQLTAPNGQAVPPLRVRYTTGNAIRQSTCELFASYLRPLGITVDVVPTDDLGGTLDSGDYDVMLYAWVQTPFPFGGAQQLWLSTSGSNFGGYKNPEVDRLINEAGAAGVTDPAAGYALLNQADRILSEDSYVLPLYQKPTFIAVQDNVANVRNNSTLDGPTYNIADWGLRAAG